MDADARAGDAAGRTCAHPTRGGLPWARQAAATAPPIPPPRRAASLWKKVPHTSNMGPTARAARPPPAHAAIHADAAAHSDPFAPAGAEKAHAAADGSGTYQMADRRRSGKHARRVLPRARRHTCRCCRALRPFAPAGAELSARTARPIAHSGPFAPAGAEKDRRGRFGRISNGRSPPQRKARAARPPPRTPPYTPMLPLLCRVLQSSVPLTPAGAEKAHAAADGSGTYQMANRRSSAKHARRVIPRARRHTCRCCRALRPPSRQRALKKHMPQPMVRAHIK